mmetsp:Transcript_39610/g.125954  ORF Transcript_39610/g.125954 Transcript_39610/m.125954 type:complete len:262 (+) Transcript_39610:1005-1790(+)
MSISNSCTTHCITTSSFRKGSWPSPKTLASMHMSFVGMLSLKSCKMLAVTFCQASGVRLLPVSKSSCLKPSTPMRATASVSCWMQFSISVRTSSKRKARDSRWASKSLTRAVRAARHVGGPIDAAQEAAVPSERFASAAPPAPSDFLASPFCSWWWMSSKSGLITPLNTMRHVSSSKTTLPCSRKQSKTPFKAAARTSRRGSLTSIERPRKIGNQCAAGWLEPVRGPASGGAWPAAPVVEPSGGGCSERDLSARRSAACRR